MATDLVVSVIPGIVVFSGGTPTVHFVTIFAVPAVVTFSGTGTPLEDTLVTVIPGIVTFSGGTPDIVLNLFRKNWVKWSKIGSLDFTIDRSTVAGERPLDWPGWVWKILKLKDLVVAYGENGVTFLPPHGIDWGMKTIHRIGLLGKNAVCGNENNHFFIDKKYRLFSISDSLEMLDYSEYLSVLTDPVMSYDIERDFIHICDGTYGFVYSPKDRSLGTGPVDITGIGSQSGVQYVTSVATISTPVFEICTDIYDLGTRRLKTIRFIELGLDATGTYQASIYWRNNKAGSFTQTHWQTVDKHGRSNISCAGYEFMFGVKNLAYEWFSLDYVTVNGEVGSD
ncbi:hypothetical protein KAR91_34815 [Candidatus Pacearchaeota archaeon]|nr:hypothetical protein [Candidatus Pacearchaeota archaeon]